MLIEVSLGEVIDKYSILQLKLNKITAEEKRVEIRKEIQTLSEAVPFLTKYEYLYKLLLHVNENIWDYTNHIKTIPITDPGFSLICNEIFKLNQQRFRIKNWINQGEPCDDGGLKEQKNYSCLECVIHIKNTAEFYEKLKELFEVALNYDKINICMETGEEHPEPEEATKSFIVNTIAKIPMVFIRNEKGTPPHPRCKHIHISEYITKETIWDLPYYTYVSQGKLGDLIQNLSVVNENFYKTGRKGIVYIYSDKYPFRNGTQMTYDDTKEMILAQPYIKDYKIYNNEPVDINLSAWMEDQIHNKNLHNIYKSRYGVEWGTNPWLSFPSTTRYSHHHTHHYFIDKIVVNTTNYRFPLYLNFQKLRDDNPNVSIVFVSADIQQYHYFVSKTGVQLEYYNVGSFTELCCIINSCKLFVGSLSAPLSIAHAMYKPRVIGLCESDTNHVMNMENIWKNATCDL